MKVIPFEHNTPSMRYEYHRTREGPNWFMCYYKHSSQKVLDPKDAWRTLGLAKFTESGKVLKEWCLQMNDEYGEKKEEEEVGRTNTSFASEAMNESELDPRGGLRTSDFTKNTKMIM